MYTISLLIAEEIIKSMEEVIFGEISCILNILLLGNM